MKKLITLAIVVAICGGLMGWDAIQRKAIEDATYEVPIEYAQYTPDCPTGEVRETKVYALLLAGERRQGADYMTAVGGDGVVVANYYCARLENGDIGVVELQKTDLDPYQKLICQTEESFFDMQSEGIFVRGFTKEVTKLSFGMGQASVDKLFGGLTCLSVSDGYPDAEIVVPEMDTLGDYRWIVAWATAIFGVLLVIELLRFLQEKRIEWEAKKLFGNESDVE